MNIARTVTNRLKQMGQTQTWLAQRIGVTRQQVSLFLKGKTGMSLPKFMRMLKVLGLRIGPGEKR